MERVQSGRRHLGAREEPELFGTHRQVYAEGGKGKDYRYARTQDESGAYQTIHIVDIWLWEEIVQT